MAIRRGIRVYLCVFSAGIFLFCVSFARGHHRPSVFWGRSAHSVVAYLAWEMMDEALRAHLEKLWPDKDFAQVSFEADLLKRQPGFRHTASWHYGTFKDEASSPVYRKDDIIRMLMRFHEGLRTQNYYKDEAFDLMMFSHLVADAHQPLHFGNGKDRGGNHVEVLFFGESSSLHYLWDTELPTMIWGKGSKREKRMALLLLEKEEFQRMEISLAFNPEAWAKEAKALRGVMYEDLPNSSASSARYYRTHSVLITRRLYIAAKRLAHALHTLYRGKIKGF